MNEKRNVQPADGRWRSMVFAETFTQQAVGGSWPGNLANPSAYSGDFDLYSIEYYGPAAAPPASH